MRHTRLLVAVLCTALLAVAGHADAKTKPKPKPPARSCPTLTDPAGDANGINPGDPVPAEHAGPSIDPLDILSVDVGTGKKGLVWVMQLKALSATSPDAPTGMFWTVHFAFRKTAFAVTAHSDTTSGVSYDLAYATATGGGRMPGGVSGTFDLAGSQLRLIVPETTIAAFEPAPLTKITGISATTGQELVAQGASGYSGAQPGPQVPQNAVDWTTGEITFTPGAGCAH